MHFFVSCFSKVIVFINASHYHIGEFLCKSNITTAGCMDIEQGCTECCFPLTLYLYIFYLLFWSINFMAFFEDIFVHFAIFSNWL